MEITGKVIAVLDIQSGTSKTGNEWKKQDFVIETSEQYPRKVCFTLFNKVDICPAIGSVVTVSFVIESHEYNGRWFTQVSAWNVKSDYQKSAHTNEQHKAMSPRPEPHPQAEKESEDFPF